MEYYISTKICENMVEYQFHTRPSAWRLIDPARNEAGAVVATGDNGNTTTSDRPFLFSVKVPEGNFNIIVTFGDVGLTRKALLS